MTPFAGALLATGSGSVVAKKRVEGRYYLEWFSSNIGSKQHFLFDPPSAGNLAVVANTAWTAETGDRYARTYYAPPRARYDFLNRNNAYYIRQVQPLGVNVCPTLFCLCQIGNTDTRCRYVPQNLSRLEKKFW